MTDQGKYRLLCREEKNIPLFSQDWWLDVVCGPARWRALLIASDSGILAAMPLFVPARGVIDMPPYTQTMGPWLAEAPADLKYAGRLHRRQTLCAALVRELEEYSFFRQNFNYRITDWLPFYWAGYRQTTRYTYILRQIEDQTLLWEQVGQRIRRNIRRAENKYRIAVRPGVEVEDFLKIQGQTFARQGEKARHTGLLRRLVAVCRERGQGEIFGGYDEDGRLHAAVFIAWQGDCAYYIAGGGDPALRMSGAHSLVLWESIRIAGSAGCHSFDFEGSMIRGVESVFREFGAVQTPYFTVSRGRTDVINRAWIALRCRWTKLFPTSFDS